MLYSVICIETLFIIAKQPTTAAEKVAGIIGKHEPAVAEVIHFLRHIILDTDPEISEQVKWNSRRFIIPVI